MVNGYDPSLDSMDQLSLGYRSRASGTQFSVDSLSYNGFDFPPTNRCTATVVPEYDPAGRTVLYNTIAITVDCVITPVNASYSTTEGTHSGTNESNSNKIMEELQSRLSANGKRLSFFSQGFGELEVNGPSSLSMRDAEYGPKTQVVEWKPIAGTTTCEVTWLVTTKVQSCFQGALRGQRTNDGSIIGYTWNFEQDVDHHGLRTYTVSGNLRVADSGLETVSPGNPKNLDLAKIKSSLEFGLERTKEMFPQTGGYRRSVQHKVHANKLSLDFTITDTEIPSDEPWPTGASEFNMRHRISSRLKLGFHRWNLQLTGSASVPKDSVDSPSTSIHRKKRDLWREIGKVILTRLNRFNVRDFEVYNYLENSPSERKSLWFMPNSIEVDDNMYGNDFSFNVQYNVYVPSALIFAATNMFNAPGIQEFSWETWRDDMVNQIGHKQTSMEIVPDSDIIVDFCHPLLSQNSQQAKSNSDAPSQGTDEQAPFRPTPEESFIEYYNELKVETNLNTVLLQPSTENNAPTVDVPQSSSDIWNPDGSLKEENNIQAGSTENSFYTPPELLKISDPFWIVTMQGYCIRVAYPCVPPNLLKFGGKKVVKIGTDQVNNSILNAGVHKEGSYPLFATRWKKTYAVIGSPTNTAIESDFGSPNKNL